MKKIFDKLGDFLPWVILVAVIFPVVGKVLEVLGVRLLTDIWLFAPLITICLFIGLFCVLLVMAKQFILFGRWLDKIFDI